MKTTSFFKMFYKNELFMYGKNVSEEDSGIFRMPPWFGFDEPMMAC